MDGPVVYNAESKDVSETVNNRSVTPRGAFYMRPQRRAISKRARADIESAPTSSVCPYPVSRAKVRKLFLKERTPTHV